MIGRRWLCSGYFAYCTAAAKSRGHWRHLYRRLHIHKQTPTSPLPVLLREIILLRPPCRLIIHNMRNRRILLRAQRCRPPFRQCRNMWIQVTHPLKWGGGEQLVYSIEGSSHLKHIEKDCSKGKWTPLLRCNEGGTGICFGESLGRRQKWRRRCMARATRNVVVLEWVLLGTLARNVYWSTPRPFLANMLDRHNHCIWSCYKPPS